MASINLKKEKLFDFPKIWAIMKKNFFVLTRDRARMIPLLLMPIFMIIILGFVTGNAPKHISTAIVSYDESPLSQSVIQAIAGSQYFSVAKMVGDEDEARQLLDKGDVEAIVEIPPNFGSDIANSIQTKIIVVVDQSDSSVAGTARQNLQLIVQNIASQIANNKLKSYQQSLSSSAKQISAYVSNSQNIYALISPKIQDAQGQLAASQNILQQERMSLFVSSGGATSIPSSGYVSPFIPTSGQSGTNPQQSLATQGQQAQLSLIDSLISLSKKSSADLSSINSNALSIGKSSLSQQASYSSIAQSLSNIQLFYQSNSQETLQPIVYTEKAAYGTGKTAFDFLIPALIAMTIFQGAVMGMGRSIAGEKKDGSLTRVFLTPTSNVTILTGTLLFYILFEIVRASFLIIFSMIIFGVTISGSIFSVALIIALYVSICTSIGMLISASVKTETQFMAIGMLVALPTMFLSGVFFPVQAMPGFMQVLAEFLPITYASSALRSVMVKGLSISYIWYPLLILLVFLVLAVGFTLVVFKREIE